MATPVAFRIAIALAGIGVRVVKWAEGPGVESAVRLSDRLHARLADPGESDAALSQSVSDESGRVADVTTYSETFETRKLHVQWTRAGGTASGEDVAICTFHFLKVAGGVPSDQWVAGDFTALETALDAWWGSIKPLFTNTVTLNQYRWYRAGPQRDAALGGPGRTGPPVRTVDRSVVGTGTQPPLPAQVAMSITEKTSDPAAWGRAYLPGPSYTTLSTTSGRISTTAQTTIGDATDTLYQAALSNLTPAVVYSSAKPARTTKGGASLPAKVARALTVDELQVDDIFDVIRSRRVDQPLLRLLRAVA